LIDWFIINIIGIVVLVLFIVMRHLFHCHKFRPPGNLAVGRPLCFVPVLTCVAAWWRRSTRVLSFFAA